MHDLAGIYLGAFAACLVGGVLFHRHKMAEMAHQERMAAMEKGVALPVYEPIKPPADPSRRYLLSGLIWLFGGAALAFSLFGISATMKSDGYEYAQERKQRLEALRSLGASNEDLLRLSYDRGRENARIPIGLGTVGFIPMGVGFAYLIFFAAERKRYAA